MTNCRLKRVLKMNEPKLNNIKIPNEIWCRAFHIKLIDEITSYGIMSIRGNRTWNGDQQKVMNNIMK